MSNLIKIIDPSVKIEDELLKRDADAESERRLKAPIGVDHLEANTKGQLMKKDKVTQKIRRQGESKIRYYKFVHPEKNITLYGNCLSHEDMPPNIRSWNGEWISPEEYYSMTNENYAATKESSKGKVKLVNSLLDLEIVRSTPEFEKKIRARG